MNMLDFFVACAVLFEIIIIFMHVMLEEVR